MKISIQKNNINYEPKTKTFSVCGHEVGFTFRYDMLNEKTGKSKVFNFVESTGSEWNVDTLWVYKSEDGFTLNLTNSDLTQAKIDNYLLAKTR